MTKDATTGAARARAAYAQFERRLQVLRTDNPEFVPACEAGCAHCCYPGKLDVSAPETEAIAEEIAAWSEPDRAALRGRLEHAASLDPLERWKARVPCPLLDEANGACLVYEVRPLRCRGWNSTDASVCEARDLRPIPSVHVQHALAGSVMEELPAQLEDLAASLLRSGDAP